MIRSLIVLAAASAFCGCDASSSSSADVTFRASAREYAPGDTVGVVLENGSDQDVGYNICSALLVLERRERGWEAVGGAGPDDTTFCPLVLLGLAPGETAASVAYLRPDLDAGTYRLSTRVEAGDDRQRVATGSFTVR